MNNKLSDDRFCAYANCHHPGKRINVVKDSFIIVGENTLYHSDCYCLKKSKEKKWENKEKKKKKRNINIQSDFRAEDNGNAPKFTIKQKPRGWEAILNKGVDDK